MSSNSDRSKNTTIKIAAKSASKRQNSGADPGPGDPAAAPSEAPELMEIPQAPTPSELVVRSGNDNSPSFKALPSTMSTRSKSKSVPASKSQTGTLTGQTSKSGLKSQRSSKGATSGGGASENSRGASKSAANASDSVAADGSKLQANYDESAAISGSGATSGGAGSGAASSVGKSRSRPKSSTSVGASKSAAGAPAAGSENDTTPDTPESSAATTPEPSGGGGGSGHISHKSSKSAPPPAENEPTTMTGVSGSRTSHKSIGPADGTGLSAGTKGPASSPGPDEAESGPEESPDAEATVSPGGTVTAGGHGRHGKKKKVTKFRYHKRITVRTHGKTSPSAIMDKVSRKDKLTPSTIEEMDPQELIRRAGFKGSKNTHWRVRLRQTKRLTKNGKTVTQTKVAYRDSEGNKRIRTSSDPNCKKCGKKLEECKCDTKSNSRA